MPLKKPCDDCKKIFLPPKRFTKYCKNCIRKRYLNSHKNKNEKI